MGHGGLYEQRVRAGCRTTAKRFEDYQYAKASQSLANQAPPWPPAPSARRQEFTTNGRTVQKATFVGDAGALGPVPPPSFRSGGALASSHKPVPSTDKPLPAIPQGEARAACAAAREDSLLTSDSEVSTSGSEYSQESAQDEDEAVTPPVDLGDLSLAELGRQWYKTFGKEVGAGPLPPLVQSPLPQLDSPPLPPRDPSPVPSRASTPLPSRILPRVSTPYPPRVLHPLPPRGPAHYPSRVPPGAWATVGGPAPNVTWLPQTAVRGQRRASRPGDVGEGVRYTGGYRVNPWALLPDEEVRW